ncbi:hypothetical protein A9Q84_08495 [Halobacteriovorax marinus]|uniref:histidine kinase n=1 Tax=Halobacteriovorax marinus TaxID=97084 RepID=A0A1Y5FA52_9BACT|nr:hypothetical protein A9Q84_08495 [Halobacteriovorax marinus]
MNLKEYSSDISDPIVHEIFTESGWRKTLNSSLKISSEEDSSFDEWQVVLKGTTNREKVIVIPEFSKMYLDYVLNLVEKSFQHDYWNNLLIEESTMFDSFLKDKLTSYNDFPLNESLAFLSTWGDIFEPSEQDKVSYFLLSISDVEACVLTYDELVLNGEFLKYKKILRAHSKMSNIFYCFKHDFEVEDDFKLLLTILLIYQDQKQEKEVFEKYSKSDWEIILNSLTYPTCLVSLNGELVLHNSSFSSLGLYAKDCLKLKNEETFEQSDKIYKVLKTSQRVRGRDYESFVFISDGNLQREGNINISSEELGIISGSIAHELNNPLAGILAALTLLKMEDDIGDESQSLLQDMEVGAIRCKKLIEVFLGFSRLDPTRSQFDTLESSLEQSLHLLRSRMVESNLKMNVQYKKEELFSKPLNNSIAAMIFYLILSDGFTLGHHQKLLMSDLNKIEVSVIEKSHEMSFVFFPEVKLFDQLLSSKLLLHLVNLLGLEMQGADNKIIIKLNS